MANRLSFLYYLRRRCHIPTWLLFAYFTGDRFVSGASEVRGPASEQEWAPIITGAHHALALPERHPLSDYVLDLYVPAASA
jgi:hypothetical protein